MKALQVNKNDDGYQASITEISETDLPDGDVTVAVDYSTLNYKDSLAITGASPVIRSFPMVPGIDLAGTVADSSNPAFQPGDRVVLNGWGVGESHWGGLAQQARLQADWLVRVPDAFTNEQAMGIGTAGYTAMLCVMALEQHGVTPADGEIIVTGAAGGVRSVAIALLAKLGFTVVASSGRPEQADYLTNLGATEIIDRKELSEAGKPLGKERWAGAVDAVGSHTLANICASTKYGGTITACGLAQGPDLPTTVMPFILRGVSLVGIDSVYAPKELREEAWQRLANDLDPALIDTMMSRIGLDQVVDTARAQLEGQTLGRVVVDVNDRGDS